MVTQLIGNKLDVTQAFTPDGKRIPVTRIAVGPCFVTGTHRTEKTFRVELGIGEVKHMNKSVDGKLKKAGITKKLRFFRSVEADAQETYELGKEFKASDVFNAGDSVSVTGISKGKGFAGVVKRHHFAGGPRTHGQSDRERSPGSIGQTTTPGRVYRGKRMAGRMGNDTVTVRNLSIVAIDAEKNIVTIKGIVPGAKDGLLLLSKSK